MATMSIGERDQMTEACQLFLAQYPQYAGTADLDRLRSTEYRRLEEQGQAYLDYTGGSLYAESQIEEHLELLRSQVFGNPHSSSPASSAMTAAVERTRRLILSFFGASPDDYCVVFTPNATGALKLVGESFPFTAGSRLLLTFDNHNSVNGIREFARAKGARLTYAPLDPTTLRIDNARLWALLEQADPACENLFAYPAQSNFSGVKHPLGWVREAQDRGWRVLLDAAAFAPTNRLDLGSVQPEFVTISFYKMFGYPTGVGALLVRKSALEKLRRPWFAGGTVNFVSVQAESHVLTPTEAGFEDGTLNYLSIPGVEIGLRYLRAIGMDVIASRVHCLTGWLLEQLLALKHDNGRPLARLYGPATNDARGGTLAFNLYDPQGSVLDFRRVEQLAGKEGISLRSGCFCNPGAGEVSGGLTEDDMQAASALGAEANLESFLHLLEERGNKSAGAIRVSLGIASNFADVWRFWKFVASFRNEERQAVGTAIFDLHAC